MNSPFSIRGINLCESLSRHTPEQLHRLLTRLIDWKMNALIVHPQYGYTRFRDQIRTFTEANGIRLIHYVYTNLAFTPDAPRELFAVARDGTPQRPRMECETRLCASHPDALNAFREGAKRYIDESCAFGDEVLLATPDGLLLCECAHCITLNAIEQWQPFLEIAVDEISRSSKSLRIHFISYAGRFAPPKDMTVFQRISSVMFDTHHRFRWKPLGESHPVGEVESLIATQDSRAAHVPINIYLLECLREWRSRFSGELYVFENLMIQGALGLPQPNTGVLLKDQATYRDLGIDGVIYEVFEPAILCFEEQIGTLSEGLIGKQHNHQPTSFERSCTEIDTYIPNRTRVLDYLFAPKCFLHFDAPSPYRWLAEELQTFLPHPTYQRWWILVQTLLDQQQKLDWIYIAYRLASYLPAEEKPTSLNEEQKRMFETPKPWDFLEGIESHHEHMEKLFRDFPSPRDLQFA